MHTTGVKLYLIFLLWSAGYLAMAQQAPNSVWLGISVPVSMGNRWQLTNEAGYRTYTSSFQRLQNFVRFNMRYRLNGLNTAAAGFALFATKLTLDEQQKEFGGEFRFFEEGIHITEISTKVKLQHRLRIEQRFFHTTSNREAYFAHRFRYQLTGQFQLHPKWYVNLSSEYLEAMENSQLKLDQWRFSPLLSFIPSPGCQINLGYHYIIRPAYYQHVYLLTFFKFIGTNEYKQHS